MAVKTIAETPGLNTEDLKLKGFKVHELPASVNLPVANKRRDYYKMGIFSGQMTIHYGDRLIEVNDTVLFFVNPHVPHTVLQRSKSAKGYACLFTEGFINSLGKMDALKRSPLFQIHDSPAVPLNNEQALFITDLFKKMLAIHQGDYSLKHEFLRTCIELILLEALRIQPSQHASHLKNGAARITQLFLDLLERQFPIERVNTPLKLRTVQNFAESLSVHVNYLNRAVKTVTGKPTSVLLAERISAEAKALLHHTDWSVADIAYALGFEYPTYFNNFFKRMTGSTPTAVRKKQV